MPRTSSTTLSCVKAGVRLQFIAGPLEHNKPYFYADGSMARACAETPGVTFFATGALLYMHD